MAGRKSLNPSQRKNNSQKNDLLFAEKIRDRRAQLGINQTELGRRMGIPAPRVSIMESGIFPSSRERIVSLADALDVDLNWLFGREWPKEKKDVQ